VNSAIPRTEKTASGRYGIVRQNVKRGKLLLKKKRKLGGKGANVEENYPQQKIA